MVYLYAEQNWILDLQLWHGLRSTAARRPDGENKHCEDEHAFTPEQIAKLAPYDIEACDI
jgi:hypothetical protein